MYTSPDMTPAVRARHNIEVRIVKSLVKELLADGFWLAVDDGGEELAQKPTDNKKKILDALINTDEDYLMVHEAGVKGERIGWVRLVYGNDGWDVICDYTCNLEDEKHITETLALVYDLSE